MHIGYGVLHLALLASNVAAFYPVPRPGGNDGLDGTGAKKRSPFYILPSDQSKEDASKPVTVPIRRRSRNFARHSMPIKRDNTYSVETAIPPTLPNSMALNNDGADYSYFSTVKLGSSGKELWMLIDTGAAHSWVFGSDCATKACQAHRTFGSADSTTLVKGSAPWNVSYGTGSVSGHMITDTVAFAGFSISMSLGSASSATDEFLQFPIDGILGLGRASIGDPKIETEPTIMDVLASQKLLPSNIVGINIWRHSDPAHNGEVNFGAVDTSIISGTLTWVNSEGSDGLWGIPLDDAFVGGSANSVGFTGKRAIIDTGTSVILMPKADAVSLLSKFSGYQNSGENFQLPCDIQGSIGFSFGGVQFNIPPIDFLADKNGNLCNVNIIGRQTFGPNDWLVGDTFLKNVYAAFDFDKSRIGLASKKAASAQSTTVSSSSSTSSSSSSGQPSSTSSASSSLSTSSSSSGVVSSSSSKVVLSPVATPASGGLVPGSSSSTTTSPSPTVNPSPTATVKEGGAQANAVSIAMSIVTIMVTAVVTVS